MHGLRGNYILFVEKLGTTSYGLSSLFSYVSAKLQNALPDFIVPMSLLVRVSVKFIEICNKVVLSLGCNSRVKETV